ncbi:pimeloyl-ACP methyl ester carboxylesterase [Orbus hercynius]|uniref:Pimeloyl-ACP methyl ester carboxylesterase n=1 Tax=Orbus hercynius TaxID=593135 RepID=A0A495RIE1_9GAMM|nr:alpha/beta fold hydrolase [Orbus hercynius]RKS87080.1 pimeloyl-ACP methyl ester carboxylesterase [Orbus hercynius]
MSDKEEIKQVKNIIQSYFKAFAECDVEKAISLLTDDIVWHVDGDTNIFSIGLMSGKEQIGKWISHFPKMLTPTEFNINHTLINGNEVVTLGNFRYRVNKTGHLISSDMAIHFTLRDNKIARYHIFEDSLLLSQSFNYYQDCTKKEINLNGTRYAYSDRGNGPTLIFMHGLFADRSIFEAQVSELEKNYRCITFDLPAHGMSDYPKEGWELKDLAEDVTLFIKELKLDPATLIGQSQGGMIAMLMAALNPSLISNMVLIGTSARQEYSERIEQWQKAKETIMQGSFNEKESLFKTLQSFINTQHWLKVHDTEAISERKKMQLNDNIGLCLAIDAATINRQDIRAYLPKITAKTLVICDEEDHGTPIEINKEISDAIANSQLVILKGVAHHPPTESPSEVLEHIQSFLQKDSCN